MLPEVILRSITKPTSAFITSIVLKNYLWHIFPPTVFATDSDLPLLLGGMSPYRLRLEPQPFLLPIYESRCAPIDIWPSAPARRWTSLELYTKLLPAQPSQLLHEFQPLQSTFGPFSVTSAILSTLNHGTDKVLSFWKRADAYVLCLATCLLLFGPAHLGPEWPEHHSYTMSSQVPTLTRSVWWTFRAFPRRGT